MTGVQTCALPISTADDSTQRGQSSQSTISGAKHRSTTADDSTQRGHHRYVRDKYVTECGYNLHIFYMYFF